MTDHNRFAIYRVSQKNVALGILRAMLRNQIFGPKCAKVVHDSMITTPTIFHLDFTSNSRLPQLLFDHTYKIPRKKTCPTTLISGPICIDSIAVSGFSVFVNIG